MSRDALDGELAVRPTRTLRIDEPGHWNVLATARPNRAAEVRATLAELGIVLRSPFPNVFLARVDDVAAFSEDLAVQFAAQPGAAGAFARAFPAQHTFHFESLADLEAAMATFVDEWADDLAGASFHVRCRRRGRSTDLDPVEAEDYLGDAVMLMLADRGTPGRIDFRDPDVVIDIETLNTEGAVSLWTRDGMRSFSFLVVE
jgi:tRNA(Ser,Leu) C12 N-acetylase TAN1